jgi:hypothetical protein
MSNAVLYVFIYSIWSSTARLAKHDLGFTDAEVEEKQVRLDLGEHLDSPFLEIVSKIDSSARVHQINCKR